MATLSVDGFSLFCGFIFILQHVGRRFEIETERETSGKCEIEES
jgi:hypothetical protein